MRFNLNYRNVLNLSVNDTQNWAIK